MKILQAVKVSLRITNTAFDDEIESIIAACKIDLRNAGVVRVCGGDPLILRAITLYAKAHFGYSDDSEKYQRSYDALKQSLSLAGDYNGRGF